MLQLTDEQKTTRIFNCAELLAQIAKENNMSIEDILPMVLLLAKK
jgi:hypothetical protein